MAAVPGRYVRWCVPGRHAQWCVRDSVLAHHAERGISCAGLAWCGMLCVPLQGMAIYTDDGTRFDAGQ